MSQSSSQDFDLNAGQNGAQPLIIEQQGASSIDLPEGLSLGHVDILRDGQDLVLQDDGGATVIVQGYFSADSAPLLHGDGGSTLTPDLIDSFVQQAGPLRYAQASSMNDISPIGAVDELSGDVTITRTDGTQESLTLGMPIYQGDIVETAADGAVNIVFADESSFAISEEARMAIDEFVYDPSTESGASDFSVLRGVFVYTSGLIGRDDPDDVEIDTPVGSIGIRGTTIAGRISAEGDSTVTVTEGAIVVRNGAGEITLSQQFETTRLGGFDSAPEPMGVLDAQAMGQTYNVLRTVAPKFFTAIGSNDAPENDQAGPDGEAGAPDESAAAPEGNAPDTGANDAPAQDGADAAAEGGEGGAESTEGTEGENTEATAEAEAEAGTEGGESQEGAAEPAPAADQPPAADSFAPDGGDGGSFGEATAPVQPAPTGTVPGTAAAPAPAPSTPPSTTSDPITSTTTTSADTYNPDAYTDTVVALPPLELLLRVSDALKNGDELAAGDVVATLSTTYDFDVVHFALANIPKNANGDPYYELVDNDVNDNVATIRLTVAGEFAANTDLLTKTAFMAMDVGAVLTDGRSVHADAQTVVDATITFYNDGLLHLNGINGAEGFAISGVAGSGEQLGYAVSGYDDGTFLAVTGQATGGQIYTITDATPTTTAMPLYNSGNNAALAGIGDTNADGLDEYLVGQPYFDNLSITDTGALAHTNGNVTNFSYGSTGDFYGTSAAGAGDVDGDGYNDYLVGAPGTDNGGTDRGIAYLTMGDASTPVTPSLSGSGTNNAYMGTNVSGAGDFNNDGYSDVLVSAPGEGSVYLYNGSSSFNNAVDTVFTGLAVDATGSSMAGEIPLFALGDINGDGISDIGIAETGYNADADSDLEGRMHILFGGSSFGTNVDLSSGPGANGFTITYSGAGEIVNVGSAGDFNGDGYDDIALAVRDGDIADIFVVYGSASLAGSIIDIDSLFDQPDQAFHMVYDLTQGGQYTPGTDYDFTFAGGADLNGDGFEELAIGVSSANGGDGAVYVVNGRAIDNGTGPVGADGAIMHVSYETNVDADNNPELYNGLSSVIADQNGAHLVGSENADHLSDESKTVVTMQAGAGDDILEINNLDAGAADTRDYNNLANIDGGAGYDILQFFSDGTQVDILDFSGVGSEGLKGIEEFQIMNDGGSLKLGLDDIFRLLQESDDGVVKITDMTNGDGSGPTTFIIDSNGQGNYLVDDFGFTNDGPVVDGSVTYNAYSFGDYQLLIDQNVDSQPAAYL